jgi:hypothetical protein
MSSHIPAVKSRVPSQLGFVRIRGICAGFHFVENGEGAGSAPARKTPANEYERPSQLPFAASELGCGSAPSGTAIVAGL